MSDLVRTGDIIATAVTCAAVILNAVAFIVLVIVCKRRCRRKAKDPELIYEYIDNQPTASPSHWIHPEDEDEYQVGPFSPPPPPPNTYSLDIPFLNSPYIMCDNEGARSNSPRFCALEMTPSGQEVSFHKYEKIIAKDNMAEYRPPQTPRVQLTLTVEP